MTTRRTFNILSQLSLFATDFFAIYLSYVSSYFVYQNLFRGVSPQPINQVMILSVVPASLGLASFLITSVYRCQPGPLGLDQLRRILSAYFWSGMSTFAITFFTKAQGLSRLMVAVGFVLGAFYVLVGRALFVRLMARLHTNLNLKRKILNCLIINKKM